MRKLLPVVGYLVAALASPGLAQVVRLSPTETEASSMPAICRHGVSSILSYRSGTKDVKTCIELMSHPVSEVSGAMSDVLSTRKVLEKEAGPDASCAWAFGTASILRSWIRTPRSRPYEVSASSSVSEIIASTRAQAETDNKWALIIQTAEKVAGDCTVIRGQGLQ